MALTPEDVVNKRFQPTKFREGYDQDEVDDFLDEIVVELRRLNDENQDLRQRLLSSEGRINELQRGGGVGLTTSSIPAVSAVVDPGSAFPEAVSDPSALDGNSTNNLLQLARKLHDEHVKEGLDKREQLIAEGHATASRIVREAEAQHKANMTRLEQEKALVEHQIQELAAFEREYRLKLKTYIENQLRDLETEAPSNNQQTALG